MAPRAGLAGIVETSRRSSSAVIPCASRRSSGICSVRRARAPGSVIQKAIGGIENALLDLKARRSASRLRALRRADARDRPRSTVALRHDPRAGVAGDQHAEARVVRRRHRARPRGRRARLQRLQDEHRRAGRRAACADAGFGGDGARAEPVAGAADALVASARRVPRRDGGKAQPIVDLNFNLTAEGVSASPMRSSRRLPGSRSTRSTRSRSPTRGAAPSRSAPARTSTRFAASVRSSRPARWTSRRST